MDQYKHVFTKESYLKTLFFKIITVPEYGTMEEFKENDPDKFDVWYEMAMNRYDEAIDETYLSKACFLPEFSKIVGISYGTINMNDTSKRTLKHIEYDDESMILDEFFGIVNSTVEVVGNPFFCGHNITSYDIPFLIKRAIINEVKVPPAIKNSLSTKPWESNIFDTVNLWKFNGDDFISLKLIATHLGLKQYKGLPMNLEDMALLYHGKNDGTWIQDEGLNQINLTMQLMNKMVGM